MVDSSPRIAAQRKALSGELSAKGRSAPTAQLRPVTALELAGNPVDPITLETITAGADVVSIGTELYLATSILGHGNIRLADGLRLFDHLETILPQLDVAQQGQLTIDINTPPPVADNIGLGAHGGGAIGGGAFGPIGAPDPHLQQAQQILAALPDPQQILLDLLANPVAQGDPDLLAEIQQMLNNANAGPPAFQALDDFIENPD